MPCGTSHCNGETLEERRIAWHSWEIRGDSDSLSVSFPIFPTCSGSVSCFTRGNSSSIPPVPIPPGALVACVNVAMVGEGLAVGGRGEGVIPVALIPDRQYNYTVLGTVGWRVRLGFGCWSSGIWHRFLPCCAIPRAPHFQVWIVDSLTPVTVCIVLSLSHLLNAL